MLVPGLVPPAAAAPLVQPLASAQPATIGAPTSAQPTLPTAHSPDSQSTLLSAVQSGAVANVAVASSLSLTYLCFVVIPLPPHWAWCDGATAGTAGEVTVTALDSLGNVATGYTGTVHFTSSDQAAALPADYTFTTADAGVHTFTVTLKTAASQSVTATDTATSSIAGSQGGIVVTPAAAATLSVGLSYRCFVLIPLPPHWANCSDWLNATAGQATVTALDAYGNVATGYTGTVHLTSSDPAAVLPADYTFTTADAGVHTFSVTLKTLGSQSVTATDTAASTIAGSQSGLVVSPTAVATLTVSGVISPRAAGTPGTITVTALDSLGNVATGYTGTVHFTSTDPAAVLPADYTFTTADVGVHTFNVTLKTAGTQSVTATDTATSSLAGSQGGIVVTPAAAATISTIYQCFVVIPPPPHWAWCDGVSAGTAGEASVTALDAYGNVATGYAGTVHFTSSDPAASLPADYTFTTADAGVHTFNVTLKTAGSQSVTATDTASSSIAGSQGGIVVTPAAAATLTVSMFTFCFVLWPPPPHWCGEWLANSAGQATVTAFDAYGNVATGYNGTVHFASTDKAALLPADYTFTTADAGVHNFNVTLNTLGAQSLTVTDTATSSIAGSQSGTVVSPTAAATLTVSGAISPRTAGTPGTITVTALDANGNVATGYTGTVHLTSTDPAAVVPADYTFTTADAGVHTFNVTLKTAGSQSVTATDTASSSIAGSQGGIVVTPAAAATLSVSTWGWCFVVWPLPPHWAWCDGLSVGTAGQATVTALDAYGNVATGYAGTVHFMSSDPAAVLPADYTFTTADAGVHSLGITLNTVGTQSVAVTDTASASIAGSESGLVNYTLSGSFTAGGTPQIGGTVYAFDASTSSYAGSAPVDDTGHYVFRNLSPGSYKLYLQPSSAGYGMQWFGGVGFSSATTVVLNSNTTVNIALPPPTIYSLSGITSPRTAGTAGTITVTARDSLSNVATGYTGTVHFTSSDPAAVLPANYTFTAADAGVHTFSVTLKTAGTQSVTATDAATSAIAGVRSGIVVNPAAAATLSMSWSDWCYVLWPWPPHWAWCSDLLNGTAGQATVIALDAYGNVATGYAGTVHLTSTDPAAILPADYTFTAADGGVHTFSVTLETLGAQSVTATDTATSAIAGSVSGIVVNYTLTGSFTAGGIPQTGGYVYAFDASTGAYVGSSTVDGSGTYVFSNLALGSYKIFLAPVSPGYSFGWYVGPDRPVGTDFPTAATIVVGSNTIQNIALAALPRAYSLSGITSPRVAGTVGQVTVTTLDAYGNVATGYTGTVHFTSTDPTAVLPADYTFTAADAGVHTFSVTLKTAGSESMAVTDTANSAITGSQGGIVVTPAAASKLGVSQGNWCFILYPPPPRWAWCIDWLSGTAGQATVTALDAYGNVATTYTGTVHLTSTDPAAVLPADYTFTTADAGVHSFSATLKTAGTQSVTATDTATSTITGSQSGLVVHTLSGGFTAGGTPQTGGTLYAFDASTGSYVGSAAVDPSGNYVFSNLATGSYKLYLEPVSPGYNIGWYVGPGLPVGTDFSSAATIALNSNTTVNIALTGVYSLSGTFTAGGTPQTGGTVYLFDGSTYTYLASSAVDGSGNYSFGSLPAGSYKLYLAPVSPGFGMQWYGGADFASAATIALNSNTTVNIALTGVYSLSGTFTAGGTPQTGGTVYLFDGSTYTYLASSAVDGSGNYSFGSLPAGSYKLYLAPVSPGFGMQWYGGADFASATPIVVSSNATVNIALTGVYMLSGTFTAGGTPQTGGTVYLFDGSTYTYLGTSAVDGSGNYSFGSLPAGSYKLYLAPVSPGFGMQWYGGTDYASATTIVVSSATTVNIDLATLFTLSGTFTAGGTPQTGGTVYLFDGSTYTYLASSAVDGSGNYSFGSLPAGSYKLFLSPASTGYGMQWYGGSDFASAFVITIAITLRPPSITITIKL